MFLKQSKEMEGISLSDLNLYSHGNQDVYYLRRDRHTDQWHIVENSAIDPHKYTQLTFYKSTKTIPWRNNSCPQNIVLEQLDSHMQKKKNNNLELNFMCHVKTNSNGYKLKCKWLTHITFREKNRR